MALRGMTCSLYLRNDTTAAIYPFALTRVLP